MRIPWWRATPEGIEPYVFPLLCVSVALGIVFSVAFTVQAVLAESFGQATLGAGCASLNSAALLWGVYRARQQELWRKRIEHDVDASAQTAAMLRMQREQLARD